MIDEVIPQPNQESWNWRYYNWVSFYNKKRLQEICEFVENNYDGIEDPAGGAYKEGGETVKRVSDVKLISYGKIKHLISHLIGYAYQTAEFDFGYKTFGPHDGVQLLLNTYRADSNDEYKWHIDESNQATNDIKLTLLLNCSTEPYEGGDFQTFISEEAEHPHYNQPGSAIMFKSPILHRVKPVTSGIRKSLIMFIHGPKFQ